MTRKKAPRLLALLAVCALLTGCQGASRTAQPTAAPVAARAVATETPPDLSGVEPVPVYQQVVTTDRVISVILEGYTEDDTMQSLVSLVGSRAPNCVFFFTGATAADSPQLVRAAAAAGLEVGDYGLNVEKNLDQNSAAKNLRQLTRAQTLLTEAAGTAPRLLRCNGSLYTDELLRVAAAAGLQGAVRPSAYLNHRSFSSAEDAATYVQKLVRGSVLSIKLGQELDTAEYGDQGQELNERPAIDKQPGLSDEQDEQLTTTTGTRILDVTTWLLDALSAAGYQIVKPDQLKSMPIFTNGRELTVDEVNLYNPDLYANHVTPPLGAAESAAKTPGAGDVFVGDSQTVILQSYVEWKRSVDPAYWEGVQFLCTDSLSVSGALGRVTPDSTVFPQYMGAPASLENALSLMGAKRVFWMLGASDMRGSSAEQFIANLKILLYSIQQKNPGVELVIQSIPPGISGRSGTPSNDRIFRFDLALAAFCAQYDLTFCDVASALRDENGDLPASLCANASTYGTALNDRGCDTWTQYLLTHLP